MQNTDIEILESMLSKTDDFIQSDSQSIEGIQIHAINCVGFKTDSYDKYAMMHLFKQTRLLTYDTHALVKSLTNNRKHYASPTLFYTRRELRELAINIAYIYKDLTQEKPGNAAEDYFKHLLGKDKYSGGDRWSGKTRKEKIKNGLEYFGDVENIFKNPENFNNLHKPVHSAVLPWVSIVANPQNVAATTIGQTIIENSVEAILWTFITSKYYYNFVDRPEELATLEPYKAYIDEIWEGHLLSILGVTKGLNPIQPDTTRD